VGLVVVNSHLQTPHHAVEESMMTGEVVGSSGNLPPEALSRVSGGSIIGNTAIGAAAGLVNPLFGPSTALVAAASSIGYEYEKHGSDLTKWDWGVPTSAQIKSAAQTATNFVSHLPKLNR
jgi:hypothetical protein